MIGFFGFRVFKRDKMSYQEEALVGDVQKGSKKGDLEGTERIRLYCDAVGLDLCLGCKAAMQSLQDASAGVAHGVIDRMFNSRNLPEASDLNKYVECHLCCRFTY